MRNKPDQAILERAKRFEAQALEEIFDRYSQGIFRYAFRLLGDTELARECMAETFSRFLTALKHESGPETYLQAYLYRIAHNWVTDFYRRKIPPSLPLDEQVTANPVEQPEQKFSSEMTNQQLRLALTLLTPDQRQVIVLKFVEDWDNNEIARALGKPVGAIKALQHRALQALRRHLAPPPG